MPSPIATVLRCFALITAFGAAEAAQWQHFDVEDGLPQNSATAMTVDRHGLLWVGTEDGLARFDGNDFVAFDAAVDQGWLPGNYIIALASDDAYVWIAVESGGLARFDLQRERFEILEVRDPDTGQPLNAWTLAIARDVVWVGTRDRGVYALDRRRPERVRDHWHEGASLESGHALPLRAVRDIHFDATRQGYWVAGIGGLAFIDAERGIAHIDPLVGIERTTAEPDIASVISEPDGTLWLGLRSHGVMRRRSGDAGFTRVAQGGVDGDPVVVNRLAITPTGQRVAATDRGLHLYRAHCDCFMPAPVSSQLRQVVIDALFLSIIGDDDVIWAGSWNRGLFRLDLQAADFDLLSAADLGEGREPTAPRALYVDRRDRLWIGSFGDGARYADVQSSPMVQWRWRQWISATGSRDRQIWAFAETVSGDLFIGSDAGVTRWRNDGREQTQIDLEPEQMDELRSLLSTSDGQLWASTVGGVYRIDPETLRTRRFAHAQGLSDLRAYALAEWPRGRLVIGTWSGLYAMPLDGDRVEALPLRHAGQDHAARLVWDLHPDADGSLWIGTSAGLLQRLSADDPEIRRFAERDGLPNAVVYAIEPNGAGQLWLSTNRGLARFDKGQQRAVAFDAYDGLPGNEFGFGMAAHDRSGHLYFAGVNGVSRFDPARMQVRARPPRALLTRFFLRDRPIAVGEPVNGLAPLPASLLATESLDLSHREADLGFAFSALAADPAERLRFQYRLDGKDADWIDAGERRYVSYTNLAPARYAFRVRAADRFGQFGPERRIRIAITPPVWATWPFRIAVILVAIAIALSALRWRFAALHRSRALLAAEVARQTERIREQNEQLEAANQALFDRSIRDPLTGAFNRRHFGELAEQAYLGCRARAQPFALLLFDLDHFKQVNDRHGHAAGDAVLCAVAQAVRATLSGQEAMARWGGEEFVVMWPSLAIDAALDRAEAVRAAIRNLRIDAGGTPLRATASFGLAVATASRQPPLEALIAEADAALYRAKDGGRDRVALALPAET